MQLVKSLYAMLMMLALGATMACAQTTNKNPQIPEYIYVSRMERLDKQSPIKLEYNPQVRAYIDVYLERRRDHLANIIGRSKLYFPIFEEYLSKYNLPHELYHLLHG